MSGWDEAAPSLAAIATGGRSPASDWDAYPSVSAIGTARGDEIDASSCESPTDHGALRLGEDPDPEVLLSALRSLPIGDAPRLDASEVMRLSIPALQVMLAAMRDTAASGGRLVIQDPSFALNLAFEAFGFVGADEPFTVEYS